MYNKISAFKRQCSTIFVLVRHFLLRYVKNDDLQYDDQRTEFLVFGLIFLGGWAWYVADQSQKHGFMTVMMVLTGILCVVAWERLLLDNKDRNNLAALPVARGTLYVSKFFSVLVWIGIISAAISLLPAFTYTHRLAAHTNMSGESYFLLLLAAGMCANLFMFLLAAALQGMMRFMLRGRLSGGAAVRVQTLLVMGLVSVLVWFPRVYGANPQLADEFSPLHYVMPPLWFNGLHEYLTGSNLAVHRFHALVCLVALALLLAAYLLCLPLGLRLAERRENGVKRTRPGVVSGGLRRIWHRLVLRHPLERAVFYFFLHHLKRNRRTRIKLALIMALPIGMVLTQMVETYSDKGLMVLGEMGIGQVAFPFIFFFLLAVALRTVVEQPVTPEANWIFRLTAVPGSRAYVRGLKKAMIVRAVLPLMVFLAVFYFYFWRVGDALPHIFYSLGFALVLLEVFFFGYQKIPFASVYNPSFINFKLVWPLFGLLFLVYYFVFALLGLWVVTVPSSRFFVYPALAVILLGFYWYNRGRAHLGPVFEDPVEPAMLSLNLS